MEMENKDDKVDKGTGVVNTSVKADWSIRNQCGWTTD